MRNELAMLNRHEKPYVKEKVRSQNNLTIMSEGYEMSKDLAVSTFHEQCRAVLAKTALDNLGALTAFEEHLSFNAPHRQKRYQQIVDAYAFGAAKKIRRW